MFKHIDGGTDRQRVRLSFDGRAIEAHDGDSIAMALLQNACIPFRETPVSGAPRAPLCLMGVCFDCLVEVDGRPNVQSCMVEVREGMQVRCQRGARSSEAMA